MKSIHFKIGSTHLWRVVCGVAPKTSSSKLPPLDGGDEMANEADGGTQDTCAPTSIQARRNFHFIRLSLKILSPGESSR